MESKATSDAPPEAERLEGGTGKNLRGGIAEGGREEEKGGDRRKGHVDRSSRSSSREVLR